MGLVQCVTCSFISYCPYLGRGQWLLGYHTKDIVGQNVLTFKHPCEVPPALLRRFMQPIVAARCASLHHHHHLVHQPVLRCDLHVCLLLSAVMRDGYIRFPKGRIITGWGEWVWQYVEVRAPFMDRNGMGRRYVSARIHLLGYVHHVCVHVCVCVCVRACVRAPCVSCI